MLVTVVELVRFSSVHFVLVLPSEVGESTDTHIETEGDVDVCREVETETRSKSERIITRITRIFTLFYTEFTVSFNEEVHPVSREDVDATTVDQRVGTTANSTDETDVTVEAERSANLLEVESEDQFTTKSHAIEGVRVSLFALSVQVPSVTRTYANGLVASREVELSSDSSIEDAISCFIERKLCLCPEFEVTTASLPHVAFTDLVCVSMVVVKREGKTDIHEVRHASCKVDICSQATNVVMEAVLVASLAEMATASEGPRVIRSLATETGSKATLTEGLGCFLVETIGSAHQTGLREREATGQERHCDYFFHLFSLLLVNISCDSHSSRSYHSRTPHDARTC